VVSVLPSLLLTRLGRDPVWVTGVLLVAQVSVMAGFGVTGALSQRWGRRTTLTRGAALAGTAGLGLYAVTVTAPVSGPALAALVVATETTVLAVWGVVTSYCNERFATGVRATGFGFAYSISVVPASFYFLYLDGLEHVMPGHLTQLVLLAIGSCLAVVGASWGPETRDVDLASVEAVT
jgi:MFS family permease